MTHRTSLLKTYDRLVLTSFLETKMNLKFLKDQVLLIQIKQLVYCERQLLTKILHHLREVERRKLFSDLGYQSLFEYAVKELKYSEGQAGRRIQAMRLLKEFPEIESKIETGKLNLSNLSQAQSYFREVQKQLPQKQMSSAKKMKVLESLENKSARDGQKVLLQLQPQKTLPKERERIITETHTEVSFVITQELKNMIEELRSLLGSKGAKMSLAELVTYMTGVSIEKLKAKKFGKKRTQNRVTDKVLPSETSKTPASELHHSKNPRKILRAIQHKIWYRDKGKCTQCGSQRNLNIDHIKPVALGGDSQPENLRILCFHCNQRKAIKIFGVDSMRRHQIKNGL